MSGIALIVPVLGMGVFTGIFSSAVLLISSICLYVAEVPALIPEQAVLPGRLVAFLPYYPITFYYLKPSLLTSEFG